MRYFLGLFALLACAACTPVVLTPGASVATPALSDTEFIASDGKHLPLTVFAADQPKAILVALHGFNDYAAHFDAAGAYWAAQGITTLAYDQRGFGRNADRGLWTSDQAMIDDARLAVALARRHYPGLPVFLLGTSMGAAVAMAAAGELPGVAADGIVLVSPALWGWQSLNDLYAATLWLTAHIAPGWTLTGAGLDRIATDNIDILRRMGADPYVVKGTRVDAIYGLVGLMGRGAKAAPMLTLPTLLLMGSQDEIVPPEPVETAAAQIPGSCRFVYYQAGYHMLLVDVSAERVWNEIADFVLDREGPRQVKGCVKTTVPPPEFKRRIFR